MKAVDLTVQTKADNRKTTNRSLRNSGMVPAIIYGPNAKNKTCTLDERDLYRIFRGQNISNIMLTLQSDEKELNGKKVVVKAIDKHPVRWTPTHVDFYELDLNEPLTVPVPIEFKGTPKGVKLEGGILNVVRRSVEVKALPNHLPEKIEVDISALEINDSLHISDLNVSENVTIMDSEKFTIVSVAEPAKEEEPTPAELEAAVEGAEAAEGEASAGGEGAEAAAGSEGEEKKD